MVPRAGAGGPGPAISNSLFTCVPLVWCFRLDRISFPFKQGTTKNTINSSLK